MQRRGVLPLDELPEVDCGPALTIKAGIPWQCGGSTLLLPEVDCGPALTTRETQPALPRLKDMIAAVREVGMLPPGERQPSSATASAAAAAAAAAAAMQPQDYCRRASAKAVQISLVPQAGRMPPLLWASSGGGRAIGAVKEEVQGLMLREGGVLQAAARQEEEDVISRCGGGGGGAVGEGGAGTGAERMALQARVLRLPNKEDDVAVCVCVGGGKGQ